MRGIIKWAWTPLKTGSARVNGEGRLTLYNATSTLPCMHTVIFDLRPEKFYGCARTRRNRVSYATEGHPVLPSSTGRVLSVNAEELSCVTTPAEVITAIWEKASSLLTEPNAVVPTPGCDPCSRWLKAHQDKDLILW